MTIDDDILDLTGAMPCADGAAGGVDLADVPDGATVPMVLGEASFRYIGHGLTGPAFVQYVQSYDFGSILPDQLVIHNTYIPDASWAPASTRVATKWDRAEGGLTDAQILSKRTRQLDSLMRYYRDTYHWDRGPHLFVDERYIWLFTPMYDIGIHAAEGNSYRDSHGRLHYSLGIETVGHFATSPWHPQQAALLRTAVQALQRRLGTFQIAYHAGPHHQPAIHQGSIALHNDYNKAACPGAYITPSYAIRVLSAAPPPAATRYRVKATVTAGATIRAAADRNAAPLGRLRAGDEWVGDLVEGGWTSVPGFGAGKLWIEAADGRAVWANLLEELT